MRARYTLALLLLLLPALPGAAQEPPIGERPRVIIIKVDGLSPWLVEAAVHPEDEAAVNRLDDPAEFRRAVAHFRQQLGRRQLLPNLERYFFARGVRAENMYSSTVTLSAAAWSVIDTGQPSIVKGHGVFERDTGYARSYLDFLRDTLDFVKRAGDKTLGVWVLDQAGVSLTSDAFRPDRVWMAPQMYVRPVLREYLSQMGLTYVTGGYKASEPQKILATHLGRRAGDPKWVECGEAFMMEQLAQHILARDYTDTEPFDLLSGYFTQTDHQQHAEPSPEGLLFRLVHFDELLGEVFHAIEHSQRRDHTYVVMVSDHGQEFVPGLTAASVPLTRLFRTPWLGGHTTQTLLSEETDRALTVPLAGIDFPRVYESDFSPYGAAAPKGLGEKGWPTAYVEPFGNARAEIHLRNNDLNRLHLLLLAIRRGGWEEPAWGRLDQRLQETLAGIGRWLPGELEGARDYYAGGLEQMRYWKQSADPYRRDSAARLHAELKRLEPQLKTLERLQGLVEKAAHGNALGTLRAQRFRVEDYIPRKFYGPRNSFFQLSHYTLGLDARQQWVETTADLQGRRVAMNYFQVLSDYAVPNPPVPGNRNPFDLILYALPPQGIQPALVEAGLVAPGEPVEDVLWVRSTAQDNPVKGGEALILRRPDGSIKYVPLEQFDQEPDGRFRLRPGAGPDPLALLFDPSFRGLAGADPSAWLAQWHSAAEWLEALYRTRYTNALLVFLDLAGRNYRRSLTTPEFAQSLAGFRSEESKRRYLRGLERKYSNFMGDFWVWSSEHYNFSSKGPEPAGAHGGLGWRVARTSFYVWGGEHTGLRRGEVLEQPATTLDIAPTVLCLAGRLDGDHSADPPVGGVPPRPFLPFPGHVLDVFAGPHACGGVEATQVAARP